MSRRLVVGLALCGLIASIPVLPLLNPTTRYGTLTSTLTSSAVGVRTAASADDSTQAPVPSIKGTANMVEPLNPATLAPPTLELSTEFPKLSQPLSSLDRAERCGEEALQDWADVILDPASTIPRKIVTGDSFTVKVRVGRGKGNLVFLNGRALGPVMLAALVAADGTGADVTFGPFGKPGRYSIDLLATWYDKKYLGQRWILPNRNDNPSFEEKKRKCLSLTLIGNCSRFGVPLLRAQIEVSPLKASLLPTALPNRAPCVSANDIEANGYWERISNDEARKNPLLADPVGLNEFDGATWRWRPSDRCDIAYFTHDTVEKCFASQGWSRLAIFGDSMMLEQFEMMKALLSMSGLTPELRQGKSHRVRYMELKWRNLTVRFLRGYTTSAGHSVIASPRTVVDQLRAFRPDVAFGNLAVLHWQQNERTQADWSLQVSTVVRLLTESPSLTPIGRFYYIGHTLIQMGRTQGLQPHRTSAFSSTALAHFTAKGGNFIDPYNLSVSRRESAFDGQHWACYHEYGGVSHTILQLILNRICSSTTTASPQH